MTDFAQHFSQALPYDEFLNKYGSDAHRSRWAAMRDRISLTDAQNQLLASFKREMKVLVMAGAWCGDCVEQCPIFDHFAAACDRIHIRYVDRDDCGDLNQELVVCGAARVPQVVFLSEDDHPVGRYGDRTLSKYRDMAASLAGVVCPSGIGPGEDLLAAVVQDWLNEFERIQLILRTSGRLREMYGD